MDAKEHSDEYSDDEFDIDDRSTAGERTPDVRTPDAEPAQPQRVQLTDSGPVPESSERPAPRGRRRLVEETEYDRSGVQSPNRFASGGYKAPPPLSQRHLVKALEKCETDMANIRLSSKIRAQEEALARETQLQALAHDEVALREALARVTAERAKLEDNSSPSDSISSLEEPTPATTAPSSATQSALAKQEWDAAELEAREREMLERDIRERERQREREREMRELREREREALERGRPQDGEYGHARESSLHRNVPRTESEATLAPLPEYGEYDGAAPPPERTPRQGRSRTRSGYSSAGGSRAGSRIRADEGEVHSPSVRSASRTRRAKAFAFFGNDHSASELSEGGE